MATYKIEVRKSASKELATLQKRDCGAIVQKIRVLSTDPRPVGAEKLSGDNKYRIRHGDYRVLYEIDEREKRVIVVRIAHRREVDR
jgi:mRNA interferase RelE/StbE